MDTQAFSKNLIVITAPSGAGKTSLIQKLLKKHEDLVFSISHTTRNPREGEEDGHAYHFVSEAEFKSLIQKDGFLEWANVHGNYYGTSKTEIETKIKKGKKIILDVDVQGGLELQKHYPGKYIFITVKSLDVLESRLKNRQTEDETTIKKRLKNAEWELTFQEKWPYVIINADFSNSLKELESLIFSS